VRPNICQYHAVDPIAKAVAPMGRALFLNEEAAPSVVELDVEAARCIIQPVSHHINCVSRALRLPHDAGDASLRLAGAMGLRRVCGSRTEAVLLEALRVAAPAERAVRSADRANMLCVCWPGARRVVS
jgi:hypothetical protein